MTQELDKKTIQEIEAEATSLQNNYLEQRKEFIKIMMYLDRTNRFRENPQFKKSPFAEYIKDMYNISYHQYYTERLVIEKWPEQAEKYGWGTTARIINNANGKKQEQIFRAVKKKEKEKGEPLHATELDEITKRIAPKKRKKVKQPKPSEQSKKELEKEVTRLKDDLLALDQYKAELEEQVAKLKKTVAERNKKISELKQKLDKVTYEKDLALQEKDDYIAQLEDRLQNQGPPAWINPDNFWGGRPTA